MQSITADGLRIARSLDLFSRVRARQDTEIAAGPKAAKNPLPPVMEPTVTAHQFRHSFASDLYDAGVGVLEAKKIMGHADISTTYKIYTHIRERKLKDATEKMIKFYDDEDK